MEVDFIGDFVGVSTRGSSRATSGGENHHVSKGGTNDTFSSPGASLFLFALQEILNSLKQQLSLNCCFAVIVGS